MTTDVVVKVRTSGYYDIGFTDDGDIETAQSLDTAILMSMLAEVRAAPSEMPESHRRRGWIGNESTQGIEMGSKAWLFEQARITGSNLSELSVIINNGLSWMVEQDIPIATTASAYYRNGVVQVEVTLERASSPVEKKFFELWNNTGANL
jgi:phage gp46-like protein